MSEGFCYDDTCPGCAGCIPPGMKPRATSAPEYVPEGTGRYVTQELARRNHVARACTVTDCPLCKAAKP